MTSRIRQEDEPVERYIERRAFEIHMEEAFINDLFISPEERAYRSAFACGLITVETQIEKE